MRRKQRSKRVAEKSQVSLNVARSNFGRGVLWLTVLVVATAAVCVGVWIVPKRGANRSTSIFTAQKQLKEGDFEAALSTCNALFERGAQLPTICLIAGEATTKLGRFEQALDFYRRVPDSAGSDASVARWAAGEITLHRRQFSRTIDLMEQSLKLDNRNAAARDRLVYLLNLSGRRWESAWHLLQLIRQDSWSIQHLLYLGNTAKSIENERELREFTDAHSQDSLPLLGLARIRIRAGEFDEARGCLEQVLIQSPRLVEVHVQLGKLILQADPVGILNWNAKLPAEADDHPDVWMIRGEWMRQEQVRLSGAARCFIEALQRDPNHVAALHGLAQVLSQLGHASRAKDILLRAGKLDQFLYTLERILANEWSMRGGSSPATSTFTPTEQSPNAVAQLEPILLAARLTLELGRIWESLAWCQYGMEIDPGNVRLLQIFQQSKQLHDDAAPQTQSRFAPINDELLRALAPPTWNAFDLAEVNRAPGTQQFDNTSQVARVENLAPTVDSLTPRFEEQAEAIPFEYFASRKSFEDGRRMFEMTGGGVGVLDLERDGRPDLFFAQGSKWPPGSEDRGHNDAVYRNRCFGQPASTFYDDVTVSARIHESAFGQGVTVGDVDADGFDDVYVCNLGQNQLWLNQGDGTFRDAKGLIDYHAAQSAMDAWTASAAIADLNFDGQAEIYDANYVAGDDVGSRRCWLGGLPRACSPMNFRPAPGQLWGLDASGVFRDITGATFDSTIRQGNALGISVFRTHTAKLPSLFVANDQVANLMLSGREDSLSPLGIVFEDRASLVGLAFDGEGKAQACMGVATGDVDGNGLIDLFVTNYFDEPNTLYLQQSNGVYRDATKSCGLVAPSLKMLGFGTQFLDADCDGVLDLVVLNGHIDDLSHMRIPFRMKAQFFSGQSGARFVERFASGVGDYFASERLGRALATLDFDGNGLLDFVATDLERPVSLVRNVSRAGSYLCLSLVGTQSHRDAIGTQVVVTANGQSWTGQLTAGAGYMSTNQKLIHFGLGNAAKVDRVEIYWPSGLHQVHEHLSCNQHFLAVENHARLVEMTTTYSHRSERREFPAQQLR